MIKVQRSVESLTFEGDDLAMLTKMLWVAAFHAREQEWLTREAGTERERQDFYHRVTCGECLGTGHPVTAPATH